MRLPDYPRRFWITHAAGSAVVVVLCAGFYLVVSQPIQAKRAREIERAEKLVHLLQDADRAERELAVMQSKMATVRQRAETVRQRIPDTPCEAELLEALTRLAEQHNLTLIDYRRKQALENDAYSQFEVALTGEGRFASICGFVQQIHQLPRMTAVRFLDIHGDKPSGTYPFDLGLVLYFGLKSQADKKGKDSP